MFGRRLWTLFNNFFGEKSYLLTLLAFQTAVFERRMIERFGHDVTHMDRDRFVHLSISNVLRPELGLFQREQAPARSRGSKEQ